MRDNTISGDAYESPTWKEGQWITTSSISVLVTRTLMPDFDNDRSAYQITTRNSQYELGFPIVLALPKIVFELGGKRHYISNFDYPPRKEQ